jgi:membrane protein
MLFSTFDIVRRVIRRFFEERCMQVAASLSFSTLIGLVPLIAMAWLVLMYLPYSAKLFAAMEKFLMANFMPDKAGAVVARYLEQFAHKSSRLTFVGGGILAVTAVMQMLTIEHAFNAIWRIKSGRPWFRRIGMHLLALLIGPVLFGVGLAGIGYVVGVSLGLVNEPAWVYTLVSRGVPFIIMVMLFAALYYFVPNRPVMRQHALIGGMVATLGFTLLQFLFSSYITHFSTYRVVYGAFAAMPIFLIWLHLSWSIVLLGALIVAEMGRGAGSRQRTA